MPSLLKPTVSAFIAFNIDLTSAQLTVNPVGSSDHPYPHCTLPTDNISLPNTNVSLPIQIPYCIPPKVSRRTLRESGSMLGLAPSASLSQIHSKLLLQQLVEHGVVERPVWSLMLINGERGVLSVGGTAEESVERVKKQVDEELERLNTPDAALDDSGPVQTERLEERANLTPLSLPPDAPSTPEPAPLQNLAPIMGPAQNPPPAAQEWRYTLTHGAQGFHQILLTALTLSNLPILRNQPAILDLSTPFLLAPPAAARSFYSAIAGSHRLSAPNDNFFAFPCLNPPDLGVQFGLGGQIFPIMRGDRGKNYEMLTRGGEPGGRFSLGRVEEGSGFCVGAVVETRMGIGEKVGGGKARKGHKKKKKVLVGSVAGEVAGNGLRDVWVLGERFFRGLGVEFELGGGRVGFKVF